MSKIKEDNKIYYAPDDVLGEFDKLWLQYEKENPTYRAEALKEFVNKLRQDKRFVRFDGKIYPDLSNFMSYNA